MTCGESTDSGLWISTPNFMSSRSAIRARPSTNVRVATRSRTCRSGSRASFAATICASRYARPSSSVIRGHVAWRGRGSCSSRSARARAPRRARGSQRTNSSLTVRPAAQALEADDLEARAEVELGDLPDHALERVVGLAHLERQAEERDPELRQAVWVWVIAPSFQAQTTVLSVRLEASSGCRSRLRRTMRYGIERPRSSSTRCVVPAAMPSRGTCSVTASVVNHHSSSELLELGEGERLAVRLDGQPGRGRRARRRAPGRRPRAT